MKHTKRTEAEQQELLANIRNKYVYDAAAGRIRHKAHDRPLEGAIKKKWGYRRLCFRINRKNFAVDEHICAWILFYGRWPKETIDHIDNNPLNNHIENLRECSQSENNYNIEHPWSPNPESGVPGIEKTGCKYRTKIRGRRQTFQDPYEAFFWGFMHGKRYRAD